MHCSETSTSEAPLAVEGQLEGGEDGPGGGNDVDGQVRGEG